MKNFGELSQYILITENITSDNAEEWLNKIEKVFDPEKGITLDCSGAEFFSSAGLRILLTLQKRMKDGEKICLVNVAHELMEILDTTGLISLIDAKPATKTISLDGLKPFASGATGECYKIDNERVLKLYYGNTLDEVIEREKLSAKMALIAGIPTAISYDIVQVGERKGIIYELLQAKTLSQKIIENPENLEELGKTYAKVAKQIHTVEGDTKHFPMWTGTFREVLKEAKLSDNINTNIDEFLNKMDSYTTYVHGDFNPNNIMISGDEMLLIDMGEFSIGCPIYDLATIYFTLCYMVENEPEDMVYSFTGMTCGQQRELWEIFVREYFGVKDQEDALFVSQEVRDIKKMTALKGLFLSLCWPGSFSEEHCKKFRNDVEVCFA